MMSTHKLIFNLGELFIDAKYEMYKNSEQNMSNLSSELLCGEQLRAWRISQNRDISELAKCANLSVAQIQQLETGGSSLFYNASIRAHAAKKVATLLGADSNLAVHNNLELAKTNSSRHVLDDLIDLLQPKRPSLIAQHAGPVATVLLTLVSLIAIGVWLHTKWSQAENRHFGRLGFTFLMRPENISQTTMTSDRLTSVQTPSAQTASTRPSELVTSPHFTASAPSNTTENLYKPVCQQEAINSHVLTPSRPNKDGNKLHIVAQKPGAICVMDATGVRNVLTLKPQEERSVEGTPPWAVKFERPEQAMLYFQGERLHLPNVNVTAVILHEAVRNQ